MQTNTIVAAHVFELVKELEEHINAGWKVDYSNPPIHAGYYSATVVKGTPTEDVVESTRKRRSRNEESA